MFPLVPTLFLSPACIGGAAWLIPNVRATFPPAHPGVRRDVPLLRARGVCNRALGKHRELPGLPHFLSSASPSFLLPGIWRGGGPGCPRLRASNEGLLRPRVARAQGIERLLFFPLPSLPPHLPLTGVGRWVLDCAHRTSTASSCAFCEQGGHLAASSRSCISFSLPRTIPP